MSRDTVVSRSELSDAWPSATAATIGTSHRHTPTPGPNPDTVTRASAAAPAMRLVTMMKPAAPAGTLVATRPTHRRNGKTPSVPHRPRTVSATPSATAPGAPADAAARVERFVLRVVP